MRNGSLLERPKPSCSSPWPLGGLTAGLGHSLGGLALSGPQNNSILRVKAQCL